MAQNNQFPRYVGSYQRSDLDDAAYRLSLILLYDKLVARSTQTEALLDYTNPALRFSAELDPYTEFAKIQELPFAQYAHVIWQTALNAAIEPSDLLGIITACSCFARFYMSILQSRITIGQSNSDSPLLFAWMATCALAWDLGLREVFAEAGITVDYRSE